MFYRSKIVNMGVEVKLYPDKDIKDIIDCNIDNARFTWNKLLEEYNNTYNLFLQHGYSKLMCNWKTFNTLLNMLKKEYAFLKNSESSSLQQVYRDLIKAFMKFFEKKSGYPKFKSKKNPKKGFRIQNNNNNIKINKNTIHLPKIGTIHYKTSTKYKKLLKESKINNVTIKKDHEHYYAVFNIETEKKPLDYTFDSVGIDLGLRTLATLSNGLKITNLDTTKEDQMIGKYRRILSRKKHNSKRYKKTLKKLGKWINKKKNRIKDAYHKLSLYLVKNYDLITMEDLDIKEMFQDDTISSSLQKQGWARLVEMVKYKCEWYGKTFQQVSRWFASSKTCSKCGYYYHGLDRSETKWACPECNTKHDRDHNAAKNIDNEGIRLLRDEIMNLRDWGDSTVILLSWESISP